MKRRSIALPQALDIYVGEVAAEWGVQASEVIRNAVLEWKDRRDKLTPRQGRQRAAPAAQVRMRLEERT